jgi:hypothetical protein
VFNNWSSLIIYYYYLLCFLTIKLNKISQNNDDVIYYYCKYSAEEIITRNNFRSISAIICLRPNGHNNNKQRHYENLVFCKLLILLILICGDVAINPGPDYRLNDEFTNECLKLVISIDPKS